ncbi:MAG: hypothetical protein KKB13_27830 [Chloroflexi bacterium]|nr:hypothetical protein [Chloroflexota bacterium]
MKTVTRTVQIQFLVDDDASEPTAKVAAASKAAKQEVDAAAKAAEQSVGKWAKLTGALKDGKKFIDQHSAALTAAARAAVRIGGDISDAGNDTEQALFGIRAAYKDTAETWIQKSRAMQEATIYSDEAFMAAAQNMKTLIDNYQMTADEVENLVGLSADLAAVKRIDVAEAAVRVQNAMRGEAESAEFLGLTLNDNYMASIAFGGALKDTWGTLSEASKAQYRYREILIQSAYAEGKAAEAATTSEGRYKKLQNTIQDYAATVGQTINQNFPWLKVLEDGANLIDMVVPLYTALKLAKIGDTAATVAHTAAQVADNAVLADTGVSWEQFSGRIDAGPFTTAASAAGTLVTSLTALAAVVGTTVVALKVQRDFLLDATVAVDGHAVAAEEAVGHLDMYHMAMAKGMDLVVRYTDYLDNMKERYAESSEYLDDYVYALIISGETIAEGTELYRVYNEEMHRLRLAHEAGELSASEYNTAVAELARVTGRDLNKAYKDASIAGDSYTESAKRGKLGVDDLHTSVTALASALQKQHEEAAKGTGLQGPGTSKEPAYTGDAESAKMAAQKAAYDQLQKLPQQRAETETYWEAIILEAAKQSNDQRVVAARNALAGEDAAYKATLAQRKTDQAAHNAWVESEEKRIADLRAGGAWDTAWYAEQDLNKANQLWTEQFGTGEAELAAHNTRKDALWAAYWQAIDTSGDKNLALQVGRYQTEMDKLDELETKLKTTMATGETEAAKPATATEAAWQRAMDKLAEYDTAVVALGEVPQTGAAAAAEVASKPWADSIEDVEVWGGAVDTASTTATTALTTFVTDYAAKSRSLWGDGKDDVTGWETQVKTSLDNGGVAGDAFKRAWRTASETAWSDARSDIKKWDRELDLVLDKGRVFVIKGEYVPPPGFGGNAGGGTGTGAPPGGVPEGAAAGRVVYRPTTLQVGEDGPEAIVPLSNPSRAAAVLAEAGLLGVVGGGGVSVTIAGPVYLDSQERVRDLAAEIMREAGENARNLARVGVGRWP